jgi:hypothetical protein
MAVRRGRNFPAAKCRRGNKTMIPIKLTENHYINPEAIAQVSCDAKNAEGASATFVFVNAKQAPLILHGPEAEEAIANWHRFHQRRIAFAQSILSPATAPTD